MIMVAASFNHPTEFGIKRNKINAQTLFSCELIKSTKQVSEDNASSYKQSAIYTAQIQQETNIVAEVLKIKDILDNTTRHESESVAVMYDSLSKLQHMGLSFKTLEATGIGKSVSALKKHASKDVRHIANSLVKLWKAVVDEWININPPPMKKHIVPICKQQTTIPKEKLGQDSIKKQSTKYYLNMETKKVQISEKAKGLLVEEEEETKERRIEEKLEATKRKLHQGYEEAEKKKRQRRIQVIELHQITDQEHRLLSQTQPVNGRWGNWRR